MEELLKHFVHLHLSTDNKAKIFLFRLAPSLSKHESRLMLFTKKFSSSKELMSNLVKKHEPPKLGNNTKMMQMMALDRFLELVGTANHEDKVGILVNSSTDGSVVINKLILGDLKK